MADVLGKMYELCNGCYRALEMFGEERDGRCKETAQIYTLLARNQPLSSMAGTIVMRVCHDQRLTIVIR